MMLAEAHPAFASWAQLEEEFMQWGIWAEHWMAEMLKSSLAFNSMCCTGMFPAIQKINIFW